MAALQALAALGCKPLHSRIPRKGLRKRRKPALSPPRDAPVTRRIKAIPRNDYSPSAICVAHRLPTDGRNTLMPRRRQQSGAVHRPEPPLNKRTRMGLFGRNATTVGLDIGSGLIKLVAISHASGGPVLTKVAFTSVVNDAIVEGEVMDPAIVAEAIKGLMASAGIKAKKVVTAVGGRDVIIKKIAMDRMKEAEAREVIRWEAEQHVPFDMDNVELDFQILDPEAEGLQMTVLLVAAKRELVEHKLALLSDVGLEASVMDVDAFALHNAFEVNYPEAMHGVVGLVNIGHETTNINILDDGVPVLTRDIPIGTRRFKEDLQRERGLSADEADAVLRGAETPTRRWIRCSSRAARSSPSASSAPRRSSSRPAGRPAASAGSSPPAAGPASRGSTRCCRTGCASRSSWPIRSRSSRWRTASSTSSRSTRSRPLLMLPIGLALRSAA